MKKLLVGLAFAAVGYGLVVWAVKRTLDSDRTREHDRSWAAQEADAATASAKAVGGGTWPLWKTGSRCN